MLKNKLGIKVYDQDTRHISIDKNFIQHYKIDIERIDYTRFIGEIEDGGFIYFGIDLIKKYKDEK
jgi:hypothetical protein